MRRWRCRAVTADTARPKQQRYLVIGPGSQNLIIFGTPELPADDLLYSQ